jgi:acyl-CoA synthetase (AMP-forming)/AMP-acid ligase II
VVIDLETYRRDRESWRQRWYNKGYFGPETVSQVLEAAVLERPDTEFFYYRTAPQGGVAASVRTTAREMWDESRRLAGGLYAHGVRAGEVFAVQLPTWHETTLLYLAALQLGATVLPIVHIYGPREVEFILRQSGARTLVIPRRWRNIDFVERFRRIPTLPDLQRVFVVGNNVAGDNVIGDDAADVSGNGMITWPQLQAAAGTGFPVPRQQADEPCVLIYTSGTTSSPKGVLFSHNNLQAEWRGPFYSSPGPYLCNFPAGHIAGFNFVIRPIVMGVPTVYFDHFDADLAAELIERHRVTESGGTGFFLHELIRAKEAAGRDISSLVLFGMGATGVTPADIRLAEHHGFHAGRVYGSTEHSTVTICSPDFVFEKRAGTDGRPVRGNQVRIVDDEGRDVAPGAQGEVVTQGPELFIGYTDPQLNLDNFLPGGWYRTGDIGCIDAEGFLIITDRKKDIIIRGGENISSKEVEDILTHHPAVEEVAVTAMPDERYGEKVCAFVRLKPGAQLTLDDVRQFFTQAGAARQKTPEILRVVEDFPRTPTSKIKKFELRKQLREAFEAEQARSLGAAAGAPGPNPPRP